MHSQAGDHLMEDKIYQGSRVPRSGQEAERWQIGICDELAELGRHLRDGVSYPRSAVRPRVPFEDLNKRRSLYLRYDRLGFRAWVSWLQSARGHRAKCYQC